MVKIIWSIAGVMLIAAISAIAYNAYRAKVCSDLEDDYLNAVSGMKRAAVTQPLVMAYGNDGKAHELAIKVNSEAMVYYLGRISEECGVHDSNAASRKANEMVGL